MNSDFYSNLIENKIQNINLQNSSPNRSNASVIDQSKQSFSSNIFNAFKHSNDDSINQNDIQIDDNLKRGITEIKKDFQQKNNDSLIHKNTIQTSTNNFSSTNKTKKIEKKIKKKYKNYFKDYKDINDSIQENLGNTRNFICSDFQPSYLLDNIPEENQSLYDFLKQITPKSNKNYYLVKKYIESMVKPNESQVIPYSISEKINKNQTMESLNSMLSQSIIKNGSRNDSEIQSTFVPNSVMHSSIENIDQNIKDGESPTCRLKMNPSSYSDVDTNQFIVFCDNWEDWKQSYCNAMFFYYILKIQLILYDTMQNFVHFQSKFEWFKSTPESTLKSFFPTNHMDHSISRNSIHETSNNVRTIVFQEISQQLPYFSIKKETDGSLIDPLFKCQKSEAFIFSILHQTSIKNNLEATLYWIKQTKQKTEKFIETFKPKTTKSKHLSIFNETHFAQVVKRLDENKKNQKIMTNCKIKNCSEIHLKKEDIDWADHNQVNNVHSSVLKKINLRHEYQERLQKINQLTKFFKQNINKDMELMFMWMDQNKSQTSEFSSIMKDAIYTERDKFIKEAFTLQHRHSRNIAILVEDVEKIVKHIEPKIVLIKSKLKSNNSLESEIYGDLQMKINHLGNKIENVFENTLKEPYLFNFNKYCESNRDIVQQLNLISSQHIDDEQQLENFLKFYMIKQFLQIHQQVLSEINYYMDILVDSCSRHSIKLKTNNGSKQVFVICQEIQQIANRWCNKHNKIQENNQMQCKKVYDAFENRIKNISEKKMKHFMNYLTYPINPQNESVSKIHDYHQLFCKDIKDSIEKNNEPGNKFSKIEECIMTCCSIYYGRLNLLRYECLMHVLFDCTNRNEKSIKKK